MFYANIQNIISVNETDTFRDIEKLTNKISNFDVGATT